MPSARPRAIEDSSRSETSSIITNLKDRYTTGPMSSSAISKTKRVTPSILSGSVVTSKAIVNGSATAPPEFDPNLPRTDWQSMPIELLHNYRHAHRLPTPSAYTHPHADLTYKSSRTALRSPTSVLARRKLRDLKHKRLKSLRTATYMNGKLKEKEKEKEKERERSSDRLRNASTATTTTTAPSQPQPSNPDPTEHPIAPKQSPPALATTVRRHFNAQQLSESDVIARFLYVVHHSSQVDIVGTPGSAGDGRGVVMGSHGRAVVRNDGAGGGGELGFRLRFRPEPRG